MHVLSETEHPKNYFRSRQVSAPHLSEDYGLNIGFVLARLIAKRRGPSGKRAACPPPRSVKPLSRLNRLNQFPPAKPHIGVAAQSLAGQAVTLCRRIEAGNA